METWTVYEHYKINNKTIMNQLGFFNKTFQYITSLNSSLLDRRSDFHGYHMIAMTEKTTPFISSINISTALFDSESQTYDVTNSTEGMIYQIFLDMQKYFNFTATLHKRKDGKFGPTTISENGTIFAAGITESISSGFAEVIATR